MADTTELPISIATDTSDAEPGATEAVTAVAKVCSTPELLEGLLSHLPVLDLVTATGVSKICRHVIQASPKLQRQLFMLPSNEKAEYWQLVRHRSDDLNEKPDRAYLYRIASPGVVGDTSFQARLEAVTPDTSDWRHPSRSLRVVSACPLLSLTDIDEDPSYLRIGTLACRPDYITTSLEFNARTPRAVEP